jgi:hypothetical protein
MKKLLLIFLLSIGFVQGPETATDNLITPDGSTGQVYSGNIGGAKCCFCIRLLHRIRRLLRYFSQQMVVLHSVTAQELYHKQDAL